MLMKLTRLMLFVLVATISSIYPQGSSLSPYLAIPEKAIGYIDSCANFWISAHDNLYGGFFTDVDDFGQPTGTKKYTITQSRNAYGYIRAFMLTGNTTYLNYAESALNFMYQHNWDSNYGGWYTGTNRYGTPLNIYYNKSAFDQHYALLGIMAAAEATGDSSHWNYLEDGYSSLESALWDSRPVEFGYYDEAKYNGTQPSNKTFNATVDAITTHLLYLYLNTENPSYLNRLQQLADNILNHLIGSMSGQSIGFVEKYDSDWNWNNSETMTIMGHVLKAGWCLARIYQIQPDSSYLWGAKTLVDHVLQKGYDHEYGGPYKDFNRLTGQMLMWGIPDTAKAWWQMEQAVVAGLSLFEITGDSTYLNMADETLDFFMKYFVDHTYGEVFADRTRRGAPIPQWSGHKGNQGKAAYHSIELGYYTYLYGKLFVHRAPVVLHYHFSPIGSDRTLLLTPLAIRTDRLKIDTVYRDGQPYSDFEPNTRRLQLPAGVGGNFEVHFKYTNPTFITDRKRETLSSDFVLNQNYPNPFNPETNITFRVKKSGQYTLNIYNVLGQKIRTLLQETLSAGTYQLRWDGKNDQGAELPSGLYICRLSSGQSQQNRRMILLK
ncbi:MAG: hypothetical protein Kow0037_02170 [Calditrichia bacterium]